MWGAELHHDQSAGGGEPQLHTPQPSLFAYMGAPRWWGCRSLEGDLLRNNIKSHPWVWQWPRSQQSCVTLLTAEDAEG